MASNLTLCIEWEDNFYPLYRLLKKEHQLGDLKYQDYRAVRRDFVRGNCLWPDVDYREQIWMRSYDFARTCHSVIRIMMERVTGLPPHYTTDKVNRERNFDSTLELDPASKKFIAIGNTEPIRQKVSDRFDSLFPINDIKDKIQILQPNQKVNEVGRMLIFDNVNQIKFLIIAKYSAKLVQFRWDHRFIKDTIMFDKNNPRKKLCRRIECEAIVELLSFCGEKNCYWPSSQYNPRLSFALSNQEIAIFRGLAQPQEKE